MSLDQLRSFVTVAEERHVGRAAKRLCLSQPPVSRQIARLEDELGATLFRRHARGMELSEAGLRLLPLAQQILEDVERCASAVHAFSTTHSSSARLHPGPVHTSPASTDVDPIEGVD